MTGHLIAGPERPTLIEKVLEFLHLPFVPGCVLVTLAVSGPFQVLAFYADTRDFGEAVRKTFTTTFSISPQKISIEVGLLGTVLYLTLTFYVLYMTRFMRLRVMRAEPELVPLSPLGEATYHKVFGNLSNYKLQLLVAVPFMMLGVVYPFSQASSGIGTFALAYSIVTSIAFGPLLAAFVWVYFACLWGIHKFGKEQLVLTPHHEDNMLGLRPIGTLGLSIAFTYFILVIIGTIGLLISPDLVGEAALGVLVAAGIVMFFLPLNSIHRKMVEFKQREGSSVLRKTLEITRRPEGNHTEGPSEKLDRISDLLALQVLKQDVSAIPTWPFDTRILGRFAAILLTVMGIIVARYLQIALKIT